MVIMDWVSLRRGFEGSVVGAGVREFVVWS